MAKLSGNSEDPDQTPHYVVSDLGLHCLPVTLLGVSRLQLVNICSGRSVQIHVVIVNIVQDNFY